MGCRVSSSANCRLDEKWVAQQLESYERSSRVKQSLSEECIVESAADGKAAPSVDQMLPLLQELLQPQAPRRHHVVVPRGLAPFLTGS